MDVIDPAEFRSPLLAPWPRVRERGRGWRMVRRLLLLILLGAALVVGFFAVTAHWLPAGRVTYALYWVHDAIYLPLKGYTFHRFFPVSLSWWTAILVLGLFTLASYVTARPLLRALHEAAIVGALRRRPTRRLLLRWAAARKSTRLRWRLAETVCERERRRALVRVDDLGDRQGTDRALADACFFAQLRARLLLLPPVAEEERLGAVVDLMAVVRRLELGPQAEALAGSVVEALEPWTDPGGPFSVSRLAAEVRTLLDPQARELGRLPDERWRKVLDGIAHRRQEIDARRGELERRRHLPATPAAGPETPPRATEDEAPTADPLARLAGRLAIEVALLVAIRHDAPEIALGYLESIEALRFTVEATPEPDPELARFAREVCARWPEEEDHRLCAWLLERQFQGSADLAAARRRRSEVVGEEDVGLIAARVDGLFAAAATSHRPWGGAAARPGASQEDREPSPAVYPTSY